MGHLSKDFVQPRFMSTLKMMKSQAKQNYKSMPKTVFIANAAQLRCQNNISIGMFQREVAVHHILECEKKIEY